jgi:hypothetical protein
MCLEFLAKRVASAEHHSDFVIGVKKGGGREKEKARHSNRWECGRGRSEEYAHFAHSWLSDGHNIQGVIFSDHIDQHIGFGPCQFQICRKFSNTKILDVEGR